MRHLNNGNCKKCDQIFDRYPGFHEGLRAWFKNLQKSDPSAHISDAGRGRERQEQYFEKGSSRARFGQSAHNYNAALDIFRITQAGGASWEPVWFRWVVGIAVANHNADPNRAFDLKWYGEPGSTFFELPHVEVKGWRKLVKSGLVSLVEPYPE